MISVILPAYNAEQYIHRAINSVLEQTYKDFQLIIINDGSTDATLDIISTYTDPRIKVVSMKKNVGLIDALNHGLNIATGQYIARMDADDICLPTRFEKQARFLDNNPEYIACGTSIINFNDTNESYMRYPETDAEIRVALSFFERNICHPTVMIRGNALKRHNISYQKEYLHAEDYALWIDLARVGKLYNLQEAQLKYYRHDNQVSAKYYKAQIAISKRIVREQLDGLWEVLSNFDKKSIDLLCIHPQGQQPVRHFPLNEADIIINLLLNRNDKQPYFSQKRLKKILYFKKFRCSFYYHYRFNYFTKLYCFCQFLLVEPKRALHEISSLFRLFFLKKMKKW